MQFLKTKENHIFKTTKLKNKIIMILYLRNIVLSLLVLLPITNGYSQELRLTNGEWPPYMSEKLRDSGLASHIVSSAFKLEGVDVKYGWYKWKRAFVFAQSGEWGGTVGWIKTPEREVDFYYSDPIFSAEMVFFHLKDKAFKWDSIADLTGLTIGGTIGYVDYGKEFLAAEKDKSINVYRLTTDVKNFAKLLRGRVDIFPLTKEVGYNLLHNNFSNEETSLITNHDKALDAFEYHLILSKKAEGSKDLIEKFNRGLRTMKQSGEYDNFFRNAKNGFYTLK